MSEETKSSYYSRPMKCDTDRGECVTLFRDMAPIGEVHYDPAGAYWWGRCYGPRGDRNDVCGRFTYRFRQEVVDGVIRCSESHRGVKPRQQCAIIDTCQRCQKPFGDGDSDRPEVWRGLVLCRACLAVVIVPPKPVVPPKLYDNATCQGCGNEVDDEDMVLALDADTMYCETCVYTAVMQLNPGYMIAIYHKETLNDRGWISEA